VTYYSAENARRSVVYTVAFRVLSQLATFASYIVLVRALSEHDFGVFNLLYAVIPVISTVGSLGIEHTLRRFEPEYLQAGRWQLAEWLARTAARLRAVTNVVFLAVILLLWSVIAPVFKIGPYRAEFLVFGVIILLHFQAGVIQIALASRMLHRYASSMTVVLSVVKLAAYAVLWTNGQLDLMTAILADCIAYGCMYGGLLVARRRHCGTAMEGGRSAVAVPPEERRRLVRYGLFNNFNDSGSLFLSSHADSFFVAAILSPAAVGAYAFFGRLNEMAEQILPLRQFSSVVLPMLFSVPRDEAREKMPRYFSFLLNLTLAMHLPVLVFFFLCHREIVELAFAGKFLDYSWLLPVITAFALLGALSETATLIAQYQEKAGIVLLSKIFAVLNIGGLLLLIPMLGILGAVLSTGTSVLLKNCFIWFWVRDMARWQSGASVLVRACAIWLLVALLGFWLESHLDGSLVARLVVGVALVGAGFLFHLRTWAFSDSDRQLLGRLLGDRAPWIGRFLGLIPFSRAGA